jgi:uncharacterized protein (TIGR02145 family)
MKWYFLIVGLFVLSACKKLERTNPIDGIQGITTGNITQLSYNAIQLNASLSAIKDVAYVTQKGFCYSIYNNPNLNHTIINAGDGFGDFSSEITNLTINKTYYFRAFASNDKTTSFGQTLKYQIYGPKISTLNATEITYTSARIGMTVDNIYNATVINNGICWGEFPNIDLSNNVIKLMENQTQYDLFQLQSGKKYYYRSYITTNFGTVYGEEKNFTTNGTNVPTINTKNVTSIGINSAKCGGYGLIENGADITRKGVCWSKNSNPTINVSPYTEDGIGNADFTSTLTGLQSNTLYYVRAFAVNSKGVSYGENKVLTTFGSIIDDIDGNTYKVVMIGNNFWMAENLKTTKYNNGVAINPISTKTAWGTDDIGAFCYYDFNTNYNSSYGKLYNWYVVNNSNGYNVCPKGWHVPSKIEWDNLAITLQGAEVAGGKMKATSDWNTPNTNASNSSGFQGLPSGKSDINGNFTKLKTNGYWWSSSEFSKENAFFIDLGYNYGLMNVNNDNKNNGYSIRCVKD